MKTKKQRNWLSPLAIPANKIGEYEVDVFTIKAGDRVLFNTSRNIIFGGQKGENALVYDTDTKWHQLRGPEGVWMTDLPVEQRQMENCIKGMKGRVLVGGLGLGLVATLLTQKKTISKVDVIELNQEVIKLVGSHTRNRWNPKGRNRGWVYDIIHADLFDYLKNYSKEPYDYAFFDIWQSDGEATLFDTVIPLIQMSKGKIKNMPRCWNIEVMRGQLLSSIQSRFLMLKSDVQGLLPLSEKVKKYYEDRPLWEFLVNEKDETCYNPIFHNWSVPFFKWWRETQPDEARTEQMAGVYASIYGEWNWEDLWNSLI